MPFCSSVVHLNVIEACSVMPPLHVPMTDHQSKAPDPVPQAFEPEVLRLHKQTRSLLDLKMVPYYIQHQLAQEGYVTIEDLADRWDTPETARQKAPEELNFKSGDNGFTDATSKFVAMRLYQAVKLAKASLGSTGTFGPETEPGKLSLSALDAVCDRAQLETQFQQSFTRKPALEHQGSEAFLKRQFKFCHKGEVGYINSKHIVSYLPDCEERPSKKHRKSLVSGYLLEEEEEERSLPVTVKQMEHMHNVFITNLLMCTGAFPQYKQFDLTLEVAEDFYKWLHGPSIATRNPPPSVGVIMRAERLAWREIARQMHMGKTMQTALVEVKADLLFWQREVYERIQGRLAPPPFGNFIPPTRPPWSPPRHFESPRKPGKGRDPKGKGKGKKGAKGKPGTKGKKGKGGDSAPPGWPSNWSLRNPKGQEFCHAFHLRNSCPGNCGRSHNCPTLNNKGWVCNQPPEAHTASGCPNA